MLSEHVLHTISQVSVYTLEKTKKVNKQTNSDQSWKLSTTTIIENVIIKNLLKIIITILLLLLIINNNNNDNNKRNGDNKVSHKVQSKRSSGLCLPQNVFSGTVFKRLARQTNQERIRIYKVVDPIKFSVR